MASHSGGQSTGNLPPTEIFLEIFQYLQKSDLKSVRLVSRSCSHWASSFLFDTVYISAHKEDFDVFNSLANHQHLSKCVRHLKYDVSQFTSSISKRKYLWLFCKQLIYNRGKLVNALRNISDPEINELVDLVTNRIEGAAESVTERLARQRYIEGEAWLRYGTSTFVEEGHQKFLDCSSRQEATKHDRKYWETVARGMDQFENLDSGEVYAGWYYFDGLDLSMVHCSSHGYSSQTGPPLKRSWNPVHLRPFDEPDSDLPVDPKAWEGTYEFAMMNQFLKWAPHPLKSLDMGGLFLNPTTFDIGNKTCIGLLEEGFKTYARIETLILFIEHGELTEFLRGYPMPGLAALIDSAIHLKHLKLTLPINNGFYDEYYTLSDVFPLKYVLWPNLKSLAIEKISFDATHWMTLLHFKLPNLRSLEVDEIELAAGSWEDVIECMSHHLNLSFFDIGSMCMGTGLLYPGQSLLWTRGVITEGQDHSFKNHGEHRSFLRDIENFVVRGGRHPCLNPEQPDDAFHAGSEQLISAAQSVMQHGGWNAG